MHMDMQWLKNDFLGYLDGWEALLNSNEELEKAAKQKMCLSRDNLEGYRKYLSAKLHSLQLILLLNWALSFLSNLTCSTSLVKCSVKIH